MKRLVRYFTLIRIMIRPGGYKRGTLLKKWSYFGAQGNKCYLQPWNYGTEPHLIKMGDNVHIASGVTFVNHDVMFMMFNNMENSNFYREKYGEINIGNNVFIGANSTILYDVIIGNNVIIGAGALVTRSIPSNSIAVGVPAKVIGKYDDYMKRNRTIDVYLGGEK